jgi:hypothetical protein
MSSRTSCALSVTPSIIELASLVSGMFAGSITSVWALHSSAMAAVSSRDGVASARRAGVRTGLPSRTTAKSAPSSTTPALS